MSPEQAQELLRQALSQQQAGRLEAAQSIYLRLLEHFPRQPVVLHYFGLLRHQKGEHARALVLMEQARAALSGDAVYWNNRALVHEGLDQIPEAVACLERAVSLKPDYVDAWFNLGVYRERAGDVAGAVEALQQAIRLAPGHYKARHNLGLLLLEHERFHEAEVLYRESLELRPDFAEFHEGLITALVHLGRQREAMAQWDALQQLAHREGGCHLNLGKVHRLLGEYDNARMHYQAHLELEPDSTSALCGLIQTGRIKEEDRGLVERIESLLERPGLSSRSRYALLFALAKGREDLGEVDAAFEACRMANELRSREIRYDAPRQEQQVERIIGLFDEALFRRYGGVGDGSSRPLFILGMPRSGTTLIEQILAAHPDVAAGGELPHLSGLIGVLRREGGVFPDLIAGLHPERFRELAESYLQRLSDVDPRAPRITDKMPLNHRWIGLIHLLFPHAAIIHCRRDPVDTCLSIYQQNFNACHSYAWRLEDIAHQYGLYRRLMDHWESVLPGRVLHLDYEALVMEPEPVVRRLLAHCGLDWNDACLHFHRVERAVMTASAWQVRQPLYTSSVKRWKRYEKYLGPLLEGLAPWLDAEAAGG